MTPCALPYFEVIMPAIASLEDLKSAQIDLLAEKDLNELKAAQGITICDSIPSFEFHIPHLEGSGTVERGRDSVNSVDLTPILP